MTKPSTEVAGTVDFSAIRYAQVWEDADVLLEALDIQPGSNVLSIASAGDNALACLLSDPGKVVALDLNPAQLACVELRMAAIRNLEQPECLTLVGSRPASPRERLDAYQRCKSDLSPSAKAFWDAHAFQIESGIGSAGKFESYFALFRTRLLPWVHTKKRIAALMEPRSDRIKRESFYETHWNTWRWRLLFNFFFSRFVMGRLGRDKAFFKYVEGSVADRILTRTRHALVELRPNQNPYLNWILTGQHGEALPTWLRKENYYLIRERLDRLELYLGTIEQYLDAHPDSRFSAFNLSDIFEYMSEENTHTLLARILAASNPEARLAYWNMLVPRNRPERMKELLKSHPEEAHRLHLQDKAFFYSRFILESVKP